MSQTIETRVRQRERRRAFLTFFSIVLAVYGLINFYIFIRLKAAIPADSWFSPVFIALFLFTALSYLGGQYLESKYSTSISDILSWIGAFWLGAMTWFFLAAVAIDLIRLLDHFIHFIPPQWFDDPLKTNGWIATTISSFILLSMMIGFVNARNVRIKSLRVQVDKQFDAPIRIAAISDMHMGSLIGRRMVRQMVDKINSIQPDIVLMLGDQVDGNPHPVMQRDLGSELSKIESKYGVYAITGNHEYIGDVETSCAYLEAHGIRMVRDSVVEVAGIYLVGREDRAAKQFAHMDRKPLPDILATVDRTKPIILMDHTPFHLEEAEENHVDLQLSGHTHHAQLWPWNYITQRVYEVSWGYLKKGNTHIYVSCGAGTWGPPIRIGNTPEIIDIRLEL